MKHQVGYIVGDWILVEGKPYQIAAIHQKKVGYHRWEGRLSWVRLDQITHIPLTPDLLLKNEFNETRKGCYEWRRDAGDGFFCITLEDRLDGLWDMIVEDYDRFSGNRLRKEVEGRFLKLHHLQHEFILEEVKKEFVIE